MRNGKTKTTLEQPQGLRPLAESFPNSRKIEVGDLKVPVREISLTDGTSIQVYDTTGPQGCDVRTGVPKRRAEWIAKRKDDKTPTQLWYARQGVITEEMRFCAIREGVDPELVRSEIAGFRNPLGQRTSVYARQGEGALVDIQG